jgi:hypothetical protein
MNNISFFSVPQNESSSLFLVENEKATAILEFNLYENGKIEPIKFDEVCCGIQGEAPNEGVYWCEEGALFDVRLLEDVESSNDYRTVTLSEAIVSANAIAVSTRPAATLNPSEMLSNQIHELSFRISEDSRNFEKLVTQSIEHIATLERGTERTNMINSLLGALLSTPNNMSLEKMLTSLL